MPTIVVSSGVVSSGLSLFDENLIVEGGGEADAITVTGQSTEAVSSGGLASGTVVSGGGRVVVASGATVSATVVSSGGTEIVSSGAHASHNQVMSGGEEILTAGGLETGTTVFSGGVLELSAVIGSGATAFSGETTLPVVVSGVRVLRGGVVNQFGTVVRSGGRLVVKAAGIATTAIGDVIAGGVQVVYGGAADTKVRVGGEEIVGAGGVSDRVAIGVGGREVVRSGGTVSRPGVGGMLIVASGGAITGGLGIFSGGEAVIDGTVAAGGIGVRMGSSAVLKLDNLAGFHATISGLTAAAADKIDLGGFAFSSGETASWSQSTHTLTVTDGTKVAALNLAGTYATGDFRLARDGHGGTYVTVASSTPGAAPAATRFVEAVAGFHGGRDQGVAVVHAGGTAIASAAAVVTAATSGR